MCFQYTKATGGGCASMKKKKIEFSVKAFLLTISERRRLFKN